MDSINSFRGEYRWLSNYADGIVCMPDGLSYKHRENAFQAYKTMDIEKRKLFINISPDEAKSLGKRIELRKDWEEIKDAIMFYICFKFFLTHDGERLKLLDTMDMYLEEGNVWNDTYWGVCNGVGKNHLGKILMNVRAILKIN